MDQIWKERKGDDERVAAVFLSALSRPPSRAELARYVPVVKAKGRDGLADVMWTLLNSSEFIFQH